MNLLLNRKSIILLCVFLILWGVIAYTHTPVSACQIPASGPWPDCAKRGEATNIEKPISNNTEDCVIPNSGPWPPCATGREYATVPQQSTNNCVIPNSGPWPPCATSGAVTIIPQVNEPKSMPTASILCSERIPDDNLMTIITRNYEISSQFTPTGLVSLRNYYADNVTLGIDTYIRKDVVYHLTTLLNKMNSEWIYPTILSGYRSYEQQKIVYEKWKAIYPDRYKVISARPGTSEHQLGTTIDFGAVSMGNSFHTDFALTREGQWLGNHAHEYGFTMSFPRDGIEITGFSFEPWHYRYIGVKMATQLYWSNMSLTEYQLSTMAPPCIPNEIEN